MKIHDILSNEQFIRFKYIIRNAFKDPIILNVDFLYDNKRDFIIYWFPSKYVGPTNFHLPIDDYSISPKMKKWITLYQILQLTKDEDMMMKSQKWTELNSILINEIDIDEFIALWAYIYANKLQQKKIITNELNNFLTIDINKERIIKRTKIFKDELIQETHKIGGRYYQELLKEGIKLWNSHKY